MPRVSYASPLSTDSAYRRDAPRYDARTEYYMTYRRRIVHLLPLSFGDVVVDVGCGTGLCFSLLEERIGASGTIIGVDPAPEMLELAARRAAANGWRNIVLIEASAAEADLPEVDHALFCAVHDVLQSAPALDNVLGSVRPGGGVVSGGGKWAPPWAIAANAGVFALHAPYVADFTGFDRPWVPLAERVPDLKVREVAMGCGFLAWGRVPGVRR